jgi:hypothetical protein
MVVLLLVFTGVLAWRYWPESNPAPVAKPAAPVAGAAAPQPKPPAAVTVELPKVAAAKPVDEPAAPAPAPQKTLDEQMAEAAVRRKAIEAKEAAAAAKNPAGDDADAANGPDVTDLGDYYFTEGVPVQMTLNDGTVATLTAKRIAGGGIFLRVEVNRLGPDGKVIGKLAIVENFKAGKTVTVGVPNGSSPLKITPHIN